MGGGAAALVALKLRATYPGALCKPVVPETLSPLCSVDICERLKPWRIAYVQKGGLPADFCHSCRWLTVMAAWHSSSTACTRHAGAAVPAMLPSSRRQAWSSAKQARQLLGLCAIAGPDAVQGMRRHAMQACNAIRQHTVLMLLWVAGVICWAFAPPGGLMSTPLAEAVSEFTTSVVCGKDVVPRTSVLNVGRLLDDMVRPWSDPHCSCQHHVQGGAPHYGAERWAPARRHGTPLFQARRA